MPRLRLSTMAILAALYAGPAAAEGPSGSWICTMAGAPAGTLTIADTTYAYTAPGADAAASGTYALDVNTLRVVSGPLHDDLGITLGFFNHTATPPALALSIGPGKGLICRPAA